MNHKFCWEARYTYALISLLTVIFIVLLIGGYIGKWQWTGFPTYIPPTSIYPSTQTAITNQPQQLSQTSPVTQTISGNQSAPANVVPQPTRYKTLWDWMQLLIAPIAIAIAGFLLNQTANRRQQRLAAEQAQEAALEGYLGRMSELITEREKQRQQLTLKKQELSVFDSELQAVIARAWTIAVLRRLNGERKAIVLQFLYETNLIKKKSAAITIDMRDANLSASNLERYVLDGISLRGANLHKVNLTKAFLPYADLSDTNLTGADLTGAVLIGSNLTSANLCRAIIKDTDMTEAILDNADLTETAITSKELGVAKSYVGAVLPRRTKSQSDSSGQ